MGDSNQLIFHRIIEPGNVKVREIKAVALINTRQNVSVRIVD